jgi:diguanylate cyclase (GGDEF)-like protein/PAS domain S-box-containing protein
VRSVEDAAFYRAIVDSLYDAAYFVDPDRRITYWNKSAERLTGFKSKEVVGKLCQDDILTHVDERGTNLCKDDCPLAKTLGDGRRREAELYLRHKKGHRVPVLVRIAPVKGKEGKIIGAIEVFSDNSARLARQARIGELERTALLDDLTGLPNRRCLEQELGSRLSELERFGRLFGVVLIDIDRLAEVNRTHGRDVGDDVLRMVGQTLLYNSRPFDVVGRWERDRFMAIVVNVDRKELGRVAKRFQMLVDRSSLPREDEPVHVSVSIGATTAKWGDEAKELLALAEGMLLQSKRTGRNRISVGGE